MTVTVTADNGGTPRPPFWKRIRGRSIRVRVRFRMNDGRDGSKVYASGTSVTFTGLTGDPIPRGTSIKIFGLTDLSALWRFRRVRKGGWKHLLSADHETSDRIVAVWAERGVILRVYPYRSGSGPSTDGVSYSETLCTVPVSKDDPAWTEWATVWIDYDDGFMGYGYVLRAGDDELFVVSPRRTPLQWLSWSHGRNGDGGLDSPEQYEIEVL